MLLHKQNNFLLPHKDNKKYKQITHGKGGGCDYVAYDRIAVKRGAGLPASAPKALTVGSLLPYLETTHYNPFMEGNRVMRRLAAEMRGENYYFLQGRIIEYIHKNKHPIHIEISEDHPFKIPRVIGGVWNHDRYAKLPSYIYKYLGMGGESPNPQECLWCRMFGYWSPVTTIPRMCAIFVRVDEFISNAVKMEFIFQNKLSLPEDLVPEIFSYLQGGSFLSLE